MPLARTTPASRLINLDFIRFIPMMMNRMILSLKKVVDKPQPHLSMRAPVGPSVHIHDCYSPRQADGIRLSVFGGEQHLKPVSRSHLYEGPVLKLTNLSSSLEGEPSSLKARPWARGLQMVIPAPYYTLLDLHRLPPFCDPWECSLLG